MQCKEKIMQDSETATKLDLHALGIMPQNCKQYKEGSDEILPDKGALNEKPRPTIPKAKTMQCGINGSVSAHCTYTMYIDSP